MFSKVRELGGFSADDFAVSEAVFAELVQCEDEGAQVEILCVAVDDGEGDRSYFDVKLPSGATVDAVSGLHLSAAETFYVNDATVFGK